MWSPPINDINDWDECLEALHQEIKRQFPSLQDIGAHDITLEDDDECDIEEGLELKNLYDDADGDDIVIMIKWRIDDIDIIDASESCSPPPPEDIPTVHIM